MLLKRSTILGIPEQSKVVSPTSALTLQSPGVFGVWYLILLVLYNKDKGAVLLELNIT